MNFWRNLDTENSADLRILAEPCKELAEPRLKNTALGHPLLMQLLNGITLQNFYLLMVTKLKLLFLLSFCLCFIYGMAQDNQIKRLLQIYVIVIVHQQRVIKLCFEGI